MPADQKTVEAELKRIQLPPEEGEARLKKRLAKLPKKLRETLYLRMGRKANGKEAENWGERNQLSERGLEAALKFTKAERTKIYKGHCPTLVKVMEETWNFVATLPYDGGYLSKPFRVPKNNQKVLERQYEWSESFLNETAGFDTAQFSPTYLASWLAHLEGQGSWGIVDAVVPLLAARISSGDKEGREIRDILIASGNREHEIGDMGNHVIDALLMANDPKGWTWVEKLLLAAKRSEGLRASILAALPEAHPEALRRMFQIIVDEKLARYSAVAQFVNEQFGYRWDSASVGVVNRAITKATSFLGNAKARQAAWKGDDGEAAYLALWALACEDATKLPGPINQLLDHPEVEMRFAAATMLPQMTWNNDLAPSFTKTYEDEDPRIALMALGGTYGNLPEHASTKAAEQAFKALVAKLEALPKKPSNLKALVWPWAELQADRDTIGWALVEGIAPLPATRLIPHLKTLPSDRRRAAIQAILAPKKWTPEIRAVALKHLSDASQYTSSHAFARLEKVGTQPEDFPFVEALLTRKTVSTRESALQLILKQKDAEVLASAERLLAAGNVQQRLAGLEILRRISEADRLVKESIEITSRWREGRKKLNKEEGIQCEAILDAGKPKLTLEDGLGFFDKEELTHSERPAKSGRAYITPAAIAVLKSLDKLVHEHRKEVVTWKNRWSEEMEEAPLGEASLPRPDNDKPIKKQRKDCPLIELWEDWYAKRPKTCRDKDGLELVRANLANLDDWDWRRMNEQVADSRGRKAMLTTIYAMKKPPNLKYPSQVGSILDWLGDLNPPPKAAKLHELEWAEGYCALLPDSLLKDIDSIREREDAKRYLTWGWGGNDLDFRSTRLFSGWAEVGFDEEKVSKAEFKRHWHLLNWVDKPTPQAPRNRPGSLVLMRAYDEKLCGFADIADHLIGPREGYHTGFRMLSYFTQRKRGKRLNTFFKRHPEVEKLVDDIRMRIIEIELERGEKSTPATAALNGVEALFGTDNLIRVLGGLDGKPFARGRTNSKGQALTQLIAKTYPGPADTPASFDKQMRAAIKAGVFPAERVLQLAFHAPQWVSLIESHLKWKGFAEAIYWFLAHMSYVWGATEDVLVGTEYDEDEAGKDDDGKRKVIGWDRLILERTALTREERREGCVDVQWFNRVVSELGAKRFDAMAEAARFASTPAAAKRAKYIADVLRGTADRKELIAKIKDKKLKENVRLLGLLPLPKAAAKRDKDVHQRYEILQEYHKYARGLSSLSKPDALRACEIGLENMARTAGFRDPMRMQWALEAESTQDLAKGFLEAKSGEVVLRMDLDAKGMPVRTIRRGDKPLKSLPSKVRKLPAFVAIKERAAEVKKQASRTRASLQEAMCRGDIIEAKELKQLSKHALLWPMLSHLVLVVVGKEKTLIGYPGKGGKSLRDHAGKTKAVPAGSKLRIAHSHDMLKTKKWHLWQRECLAAERVQPFKQLFRELYVVTGQEKKSKGLSRRYAGQQVHPRQAKALWAARGWHTEDDYDIWKAFPDLGLSVQVDLEAGWFTPAAVEGWTFARLRSGSQRRPPRRSRSRSQRLHRRDAHHPDHRDLQIAAPEERRTQNVARDHRRTTQYLLDPPRQRPGAADARRPSLAGSGARATPRPHLSAVRR